VRWIEDAAARDIKLIGYDRPGYGGSSPHPGRSVADCAPDVQAIADALGIERLAVWGLSGGGPHALACAALLPELVVASGVVASVAPWEAPGLDYFEGMGEENVEELQLYLSDREEWRRKSKQLRDEFVQITADQIASAMETLLSPADAAVLNDDFAEWMAEGGHEGLAPGEDGWWDDGVAHMSPWGFDLESIRTPVKLWHGRQDRFVPVQHGQWLAEHVPHAESALSETDGHLTLLVNKVGEVHEWLLGHF
jgi:pimeloyl-ACP methyl ester carboxylesterase